jgi:hypothetical protein
MKATSQRLAAPTKPKKAGQSMKCASDLLKCFIYHPSPLNASQLVGVVTLVSDDQYKGEAKAVKNLLR